MQDFLDLGLILRSIRRYWWIPILGVLLAGIMGASYAYTREPIYEAKSSLIIGQTIQAINPSRSSIEIIQLLAVTYADLALREPALQAVIDNLDLDTTWDELATRVDADAVEDTQLLEITAEAPTPIEASNIADELARQLIGLSPTGLQLEWNVENRSFVLDWMESLKIKMSEGQLRLETLKTNSDLAILPEQKEQIQEEIATLEKLIVDWAANYAELLNLSESGFSANYLSIVESAHVDAKSARIQPILVIQASMILGLFVSLGLIFLLEFLDKTIKLTENLESSLGLPLIGVISRLGGIEMHESLITNQVMNEESQSIGFAAPRVRYPQAAEDYRLLSNKIQLDSKSGSTCILITSPTPGTISSTTTANLGFVMAQSGLNVIVIDANLRSPSLHKAYQLSPDGGLASALLDPHIEKRVTARNVGAFTNLKLLGCNMSSEEVHHYSGGEVLPSPSELLGSERMKCVIDLLKSRFDYVIIDSAGAASSADAALISRWADSVIMVVEPNRTRIDDAKEAVFNLRQSRADILGVVFNRVSPKDKKTIIMSPLMQNHSSMSQTMLSSMAAPTSVSDFFYRDDLPMHIVNGNGARISNDLHGRDRQTPANGRTNGYANHYVDRDFDEGETVVSPIIQ